MSSIWLSPYKAWQKSATQLALFKYTFARVKLNPLRLRSLDYNANKLDRRRCILPTRLDQTRRRCNLRAGPEQSDLGALKTEPKPYLPMKAIWMSSTRQDVDFPYVSKFPRWSSSQNSKSSLEIFHSQKRKQTNGSVLELGICIVWALVGISSDYGPIKFPKATLKN